MSRLDSPERQARHKRFCALVERAVTKADRADAAHLARLRPTPKVARRQWQGRRP
jgi:hypothetical protein